MAKARSEVEDKTKMIDNFHKELSKMQQGEEDTPKEGMHGAAPNCIAFCFQVFSKLLAREKEKRQRKSPPKESNEGLEEV